MYQKGTLFTYLNEQQRGSRDGEFMLVQNFLSLRFKTFLVHQLVIVLELAKL